MKRFITTLALLAIATFIAACGGGAATNTPASNANSNANTNTNANTAKPVAAAPTSDALLALEKQANEAYIKGDSKFFDGFLSDKFAMVGGGGRMDKAAAVKMIGGVKCTIKDGWKLDDPQMSMVDADTYVFSYKSNMEGTCNADGHTEKMDKPTRAATVWVRSGDKWVAVFHGENPIVDPKAPPPPPAKAEAKKPEPKKEEAKKDEKAASNSNAAAPAAAPSATKSANTDALVAVERAGWEAWKAKDAKKLDEVTAKNLSLLGADGSWMSNRADIIKFWVEMPCQNVKTFDVKNGFGTALSPTVEMLTFVGSADGTCFGQKNGKQDSLSLYVKEGDAWKVAFGFSSNPM